MAFVANSLIALIAVGACFLKAVPWICLEKINQSSAPYLHPQKQGKGHSMNFIKLIRNARGIRVPYALVEVDRVLARDHVGNGRASGGFFWVLARGGLGGGLWSGHLC